MNEVDDLLGKDKQKKNNNFNKEQWKENQNRKRKIANEIAEDMSLKVVKDGELFKNYLNLQSIFSKYSVSNCLIILNSNKDAMQIKDKKSWEELGYQVNEQEIEKPITILEPVIAKGGARYYNPKDEYDVSQTNANKPEYKIYTNKQILQALLDICEVEKQVVDRLENGEIGVEYKEEEQKLYMCRGMQPSKLIQAIAQEMANIDMVDSENTELKAFKTYCISYMLCKRYDIDVTNFEFNDLPNDIKNISDGKEIRQELDNIRKTFEKLNKDISNYIDEKFKEDKNINQERG